MSGLALGRLVLIHPWIFSAMLCEGTGSDYVSGLALSELALSEVALFH